MAAVVGLVLLGVAALVVTSTVVEGCLVLWALVAHVSGED